MLNRKKITKNVLIIHQQRSLEGCHRSHLRVVVVVGRTQSLVEEVEVEEGAGLPEERTWVGLKEVFTLINV